MSSLFEEGIAGPLRNAVASRGRSPGGFALPPSASGGQVQLGGVVSSPWLPLAGLPSSPSSRREVLDPLDSNGLIC